MAYGYMYANICMCPCIFLPSLFLQNFTIRFADYGFVKRMDRLEFNYSSNRVANITAMLSENGRGTFGIEGHLLCIIFKLIFLVYILGHMRTLDCAFHQIFGRTQSSGRELKH